jgi:DNA repair exonuclease SbcCD ATPase subunit
MRIDELHLKAFGPFADRRLDFSRGAHGLHVIFGPNEAGKSSALRALIALLYGVDERTTDAFLCGNEQLRVGGRLTLADGRQVAFRLQEALREDVIDLGAIRGKGWRVIELAIPQVEEQVNRPSAATKRKDCSLFVPCFIGLLTPSPSP